MANVVERYSVRIVRRLSLFLGVRFGVGVCEAQSLLAVLEGFGVIVSSGYLWEGFSLFGRCRGIHAHSRIPMRVDGGITKRR